MHAVYISRGIWFLYYYDVIDLLSFTTDSIYLGLWGDPVDKAQNRHGNENAQRHQQFPSSSTSPPAWQAPAPNGGEHLLADGMSHKLDKENKQSGLPANCQSIRHPIRHQRRGQTTVSFWKMRFTCPVFLLKYTSLCGQCVTWTRVIIVY